MAKNEKDKIDYLKDILQSHIELDIMLLADMSASDNLYKLILLLANRVGSKLDVSKIATFLGVNRARVSDYIFLLEATYLIRLVLQFTSGKDKEITMTPKLYFSDNGLLNLSGQISSRAQFENMVNNQLSSQGELNYYERLTGTEIDLIFKKIAVEVKETPIPEDLSQLKVRAEKTGLSEAILVGRNDAPKGFNRYHWGGCIFVK